MIIHGTNYHGSYRNLYDQISPSALPFNSNPNAAANGEAPKFISLPTKRNAPLQQNRVVHPAPAMLGGLMKNIAAMAKKAVSKSSPSIAADSSTTLYETMASVHVITPSTAAAPATTPIGASRDTLAANKKPLEKFSGENSVSYHLDFKKALLPFLLETCSSFLKHAPRDSVADALNKDLDRLRAYRTADIDGSVRTPSMAGAVELTTMGSRLSLDENIPDEMRSMLPSPAQWNGLDELRVHAGAPDKSEFGIEKLLRYYSQLLRMEETFPFQTNKVEMEFFWFESFSPDRRVITTCIQYEKAAVLYNVAAMYSQLACAQRLWTKEGKRQASQYFQKAAGVLLYIRDSIFQRIQMHIDKVSDLSDHTLSAVAQLMLAQSVECFFDRANQENASSKMTSMVAAQTADYFDVALTFSKADVSVMGRQRFLKDWIAQIATKVFLYRAISHFHAPLIYIAEDQSVGERVARLTHAKNFCAQAVQKAREVPAPLQEIVKGYEEVINNAHMLAEASNLEHHNHAIIDPQLVTIVKRPTESLVAPTPFEPIAGDLNRFSDAFALVQGRTPNDGVDSLLAISSRVIYAARQEMTSCCAEVDSVVGSLQLEDLTNTRPSLEMVLRQNHLNAKALMKDMDQYRSDESALSNFKILDTLEKLDSWICQNLHEAADILGTLSKAPQTPQVQQHIQASNEAILQLSNLTHPHMATLEQLKETYRGVVEKFEIQEWTEARMKEILPCLANPQREVTENDARIERERAGLVQQQHGIVGLLEALKKHCGLRVEEIRRFEQDLESLTAGNIVTITSILPARRLQLQAIEDSVAVMRQQKESLLKKIWEISESLRKTSSLRDHEALSAEIIADFKENLKKCITFRETVTKELRECEQLRDESARVLQFCKNLKPDHPSGGDSNPRTSIVPNVEVQRIFNALTTQNERRPQLHGGFGQGIPSINILPTTRGASPGPIGGGGSPAGGTPNVGGSNTGSSPSFGRMNIPAPGLGAASSSPGSPHVTFASMVEVFGSSPQPTMGGQPPSPAPSPTTTPSQTPLVNLPVTVTPTLKDILPKPPKATLTPGQTNESGTDLTSAEDAFDNLLKAQKKEQEELLKKVQDLHKKENERQEKLQKLINLIAEVGQGQATFHGALSGLPAALGTGGLRTNNSTTAVPGSANPQVLSVEDLVNPAVYMQGNSEFNFLAGNDALRRRQEELKQAEQARGSTGNAPETRSEPTHAPTLAPNLAQQPRMTASPVTVNPAGTERRPTLKREPRKPQNPPDGFEPAHLASMDETMRTKPPLPQSNGFIGGILSNLGQLGQSTADLFHRSKPNDVAAAARERRNQNLPMPKRNESHYYDAEDDSSNAETGPAINLTATATRPVQVDASQLNQAHPFYSSLLNPATSAQGKNMILANALKESFAKVVPAGPLPQYLSQVQQTQAQLQQQQQQQQQFQQAASAAAFRSAVPQQPRGLFSQPTQYMDKGMTGSPEDTEDEPLPSVLTGKRNKGKSPAYMGTAPGFGLGGPSLGVNMVYDIKTNNPIGADGRPIMKTDKTAPFSATGQTAMPESYAPISKIMAAPAASPGLDATKTSPYGVYHNVNLVVTPGSKPVAKISKGDQDIASVVEEVVMSHDKSKHPVEIRQDSGFAKTSNHGSDADSHHDHAPAGRNIRKPSKKGSNKSSSRKVSAPAPVSGHLSASHHHTKKTRSPSSSHHGVSSSSSSSSHHSHSSSSVVVKELRKDNDDTISQLLLSARQK